MRVGVLKRFAAILQATRLVSSDCVTAISMSASSMPASIERRGVRRAADHGAQVELVLQVPEPRRLVVDERDVVLLGDEAFGERRADLPGAENDDFHDRGSL